MVRKINHSEFLQDYRITRFQDIFPHSKFFILHFTFFILHSKLDIGYLILDI
jgi:hypothetical protein